MKKRGQFYLIAAIIIIGVIIGFVTVSNYSKIGTSTKVYDLGEELKIESAEILDYGTYSGLDEEQMVSLLEGFIEAYSEYGEIESLYFIFGNLESIIVMGYQELESEIVVITDAEVASKFNVKAATPSSKEFFFPGNKITIIINDIEYSFDLKPGENFYFIISLTDEGETQIYVSDE